MTSTRKPVRSVVRAVAVIEAIGSGTKGPSAIAAELEISKGTVFDLLKTLESVGFVRQDMKSEEYLLGPALIRLAEKGSSKLDIVEIASAHLQRLSDETGEVTHLGQRDGFNAIYLHRANSQKAARMLSLNSLLGAHTPLHCTSMGKIFMAHMSDVDFDEYLERNREKYTKHTICETSALRTERIKIIEQGYALNNGEFEEGVSSIAVPIRQSQGAITMGINFAMPSIYMPKSSVPNLLKKLVLTATAIEKQLGII